VKTEPTGQWTEVSGEAAAGRAQASATGSPWSVRAARSEDAEAIADILVEAFPGLYRWMFGPLRDEELAWLLTELYRAGLVALRTTRVCERGGRVVGAMVLRVGEPLAQGSIGAYWRLLCHQLGLLRALRAFVSSILAYKYLERRTPQAADLVYIEALAVAAAERGRGAGTKLLEDAARWALEQGRTRLALHVLLSNTDARRLYERMGFRPLQDGLRPRWARLFARRPPRWAGLLMTRPAAGISS